MAINADKGGLGFLRFLNFLYLATVLVLAVVSFIRAGEFSEENIVNTWASLNELDRIHFDSDINNLIDENKTNLVLHGIYNIVLLVLFIVLNCLI